MSDFQYDLIVIGGGPGGYVAAIRAAQLGGKVALVEKDKLGGTCLNRGCIPTKALLASVKVLAQTREAAEFGVLVDEVVYDFAKIMARKNEIVENLVGGIGQLCQSYGVEVIKGAGSFTDQNTISVKNGEVVSEITASNIIIATGSEPANIPVFGIDGQRVITSNEALNLESVPESILIVGGGVIGCEFACILNELGCQVTIVEMMPQIIPTEDIQIARRLATIMKKSGVVIHTKTRIEQIDKQSGGIKATLDNGKEIEAEMSLISIGRSLNTKGLVLENAGVRLSQRGAIEIDERCRTNVKHVFAIGDVTAKIMLAHLASAQGLVAAENALGHVVEIDYEVVPSCIFTHPEIASVGLTAAKAKEKGLEVKEGTFNFRGLGKAVTMGETEGMVRLTCDAESDVVLGGQIIGPHATDLIGEIALAIRHRLTAKDIAGTIHAHPTLPEAVMEAAEDVHGLSIHLAKKRKR